MINRRAKTASVRRWGRMVPRMEQLQGLGKKGGDGGIGVGSGNFVEGEGRDGNSRRLEGME
jgi:hypothetical protein